MTAFAFPTAAELALIEQDKIPRLTQDRIGFQLMPLRDVDSHVLAWEQLDNYTGLQQVRGLDGHPPRVKRLGGKRFIMEPGVYGEFTTIDELELTTRRQYGTWGAPINIDDLVMGAQDHLLGRRLDRIEFIVWTLIVTGTFSVAGPSGAVIHTDAYTTQTYTAAVTWATAATATPLANLRDVQLLSRGRSVDFGAGAMAIMNRTTFNSLAANTNANDLAGRFTVLQNTVRSPNSINMILTGEGLPNIVVYDEGYIDEAGTFQLFVPNNRVVMVGRRLSGAPIGEYRMTRNVNNPGMAPGSYTAVIDRGAEGSGRIVPRIIEVHDGHNGGPALYHPGSIVVMTV